MISVSKISNLEKNKSNKVVKRRNIKNGSQHHLFKEGKITQEGYTMILVGVRKYKLEHRLIMEKHLGRKLLSHEVVHHIDGNRKNNVLSNLKLMNRKEHQALHDKERTHQPIPVMRRKSTDTTLECIDCKKMKPFNEFNKSSSNWSGLHHYCKTCLKIRNARRSL